MRLLSALLIAALPAVAFAAGSDDSEPPQPTATTTECTGGQVFDDTTKKCIDPTSGSLSDDTRFKAVRELAWAGRYDDAMTVLSAMTEGETDRVMTYQGFILRKSGHIEAGIQAYEAALALNPPQLVWNGAGRLTCESAARTLVPIDDACALGLPQYAAAWQDSSQAPLWSAVVIAVHDAESKHVA